MKRLFLVFAVLWYGVALSGSTNASEFRHHHRENHWFSRHHSKADFGKHFFSMTAEKSAGKIFSVALILGVLGTVAAVIGSVIFFSTFSYSFVAIFMIAAALSICALVISIKALRRNDATQKDILQAAFGLIGAISGLLVMLPALLLSVLEVD